jgi:type II secretory pathway predicted ATPase ExeA
MDVETLEELRLLSNVNIAEHIKLQMILVGQPELVDKLNKPELIQFAQRISIEYHLKPLNFEETQNYIVHRLKVANGDPAIFSEAASAAVYYYTEGVPRLINNICDLAMVFAFASEEKTVGWKTIVEVVNERKTGGIKRFKGTVTAEPSLMDRATEAEKLRKAILDKTKVDISRAY